MKIRLTPLSKILIVMILIAGVGFGLFKAGVFDKAKKQISGFKKGASEEEMYEQAGTIKKEEGIINISLDEWVGWKSIIDANGGLTTQKGSIYDDLGIKLNIAVINDATESSNALIKGDLDGAGYTVNRYAFLYNKFKDNSTPVKMAFITNSSTGGDGIIAKKSINRVEDLVGKKIGVPRYSEAQTLVEWLLQKSSLTDAQVADIRKNMIFFETPEQTAQAFFAGELDAAATWQPYLSQAATLTDGHVLFSTENATNIILDGIVFKEEFIANNQETLGKLLEGAMLAEEMYATDATAIKNTFPMFATEKDQDVLGMTVDATLYNSASNVAALEQNGTAVSLFADMANIWTSLGEKSDATMANEAFTDEIAKAVKIKFPGQKTATVSFTEEQKEVAVSQSNDTALLTQNLTINFEPDSIAISSDSFTQLSEFAKTAKILDGAVIQIEGNTAQTGESAEVLAKFSKERAESVAKFLQTQGLDPSRFVIVGNGAKNANASNPEASRKTDIYFKVVGR